MPALQTPVCEFGAKAIDFSLTGVDGRVWNLEKCCGKHGLLVMFVSNHCPYVKAILYRLVADTRALASLGVNSVAIMPNDTQAYPEDSIENMRRIAQEFDFPFPYLIDDSQEVARDYGAVCTPDFFGYNTELELQYRGRFDDAGARSEVSTTKRELFEAMKRVAQTGRGPVFQVPSIGCSIKWNDSR